MPSRRFKKVDSARGIYREIGMRFTCSPVVRRLRCGVNDECNLLAELPTPRVQSLPVAYIAFNMPIIPNDLSSNSLFHRVLASRPKKYFRMSLSTPITSSPRLARYAAADQACTSGNNGHRHRFSI